MNLNSVLIGSDNPQRLAEYYTRLFGTPGWDDGGYVGWLIGSGGLTVGPHSEVHGTNAEPGRIIVNIETPDVRGEFAKLQAAGATVVLRMLQERPKPDAATFIGSGKVADTGAINQPLIGWPAKPEKVTSSTVTVRSGPSIRSNSGGPPAAREDVSVSCQNASKSAGSSRSGRYPSSAASGRS